VSGAVLSGELQNSHTGFVSLLFNRFIQEQLIDQLIGFIADVLSPFSKHSTVVAGDIKRRIIERRHMGWISNIRSFDEATLMGSDANAITVEDINNGICGPDNDHRMKQIVRDRVIDAFKGDMSVRANLPGGEYGRVGIEL